MRARMSLVLLLCLLACGCAKKKSTEELIQDLQSPEERDRISAARTLPAGTGDPAVIVPALIAALKDREGDVRHSAAIKLGLYGEQAKDAIPALQKAQNDRDARVREAARKALSRIDPEHFPAAGP
jgi:HEAT repeat protein